LDSILFKKLIKNILLSLALIFLFLAGLLLFQHFFMEPQNMDAFLGLMMMSSIFGIPYIIFNKMTSNNSSDKTTIEKQALVPKRCTYCNSSAIIKTTDGLKCEHCGSTYH